MITPEKTYSNNPFVDNIIYYAKLMAMNCTIKDEEEALANETEESIKNGDILISCMEGVAKYEIFDTIPKEILEKYITLDSNLNIYVSNKKSLKIYLNSFDTNTKNKYLNNLSQIARSIYMDHYIIMNNYASTINPSWADDNEELYNKCKYGNATYADIFDILPEYTRSRIIKEYITNYEKIDIDTYCKSLSEFQKYIDSRTDIQINTELANISKAMRDVFISHYDMIIERGLVRKATDKRKKFINIPQIFQACNNETATYIDLYDAFPTEYIDQIIDDLFGIDYINSYNELSGLEFVNKYGLKESLEKLYDFSNNFYDILLNDLYDKYLKDNNINEEDVTDDQQSSIITSILNLLSNSSIYFDAEKRLSEEFIKVYKSNYRAYIDADIYGECLFDNIDYFELADYLPLETQKMILNTQFGEFTNIEVYSRSKYMLDSYLNSLPAEECNKIKTSITKDMMEWYPNHHKELNSYYRSFIGLPPVDSNGNQYEDTLFHSWDEKSKSYIEFGNYFLNKIPENIYPEIHWRQNICDFDSYDIGILTECGIFDEYAEKCGSNINSSRYKYLKYLADNKLDIYQCRRAMQFELIGMPSIDDDDARKRFVDAYNINREYVLTDVYSDAYKFQSDYYDKFMIIFIIVNTIMDMLSNITTMIIDREVFDARCIRWLFESFGVPYYSEIPLKYQRAMLKNLNMLLKYKSSTKNMIDICKLFGFTDVRVFNYYLFKERNKDSNTGEYEFDEDNDISYDLDLLWVKIYADQNNPYPESIEDIIAGEPFTGLFDSYKILNEENPKDSFKIIPNKYSLYANLDTENLIIEVQDIYSINLHEEDIDESEINYLDAVIINNTSDIDVENLHIMKDYNGVYFIKLLDYEKYIEDRYTKEITYEENKKIKKKRIIKKNADVYIKDPTYNSFYRLKDSSYFKDIKANTNAATLKFIKVPVNESLAEYKNDENYIVSYDEITLNDDGNTWDGGRIHEDLYNELVNYNFNTTKSKYISVETVTDLTEQCFQVSYFYNMLFDNLYSEDLLTVKIPYIKIGHNFRFMDIICYLFALMYFYNGLEDNIMYSPTQILFVKGYNFDQALNTITSNEFSINDEISDNNYNYQDAFKNYKIKSFNLEADMDELNNWLKENCNMTLDDFVVDDSLINFDQIITLRQFFTLNNSYYQKDIFKDNIITLPYNQSIKTAYNMELCKKKFREDINKNIHEYIENDHICYEILPLINNGFYLIIPDYYIEFPDKTSYALYKRYIKKEDIIEGNNSNDLYYKDADSYIKLFNNKIIVKDSKERNIYSTDKIYSKKIDSNEYEEIINPTCFDKSITFDDILYINDWKPYWIYNEESKKYELNKSIAYIKATINGEEKYISYNDSLNHEDIEINIVDTWVKHSDGHFIPFIETDFYRTNQPSGIINYSENKTFVYNEEDLYIESSIETNEHDTDLNGNKRYFKKVKDIYNEYNWKISSKILYFIIDNNFVSEYEITSPYNCYSYDNGEYKLIIDNYAQYKKYNSNTLISSNAILSLNNDTNDYDIYMLLNNTFISTVELINKSEYKYVYNSDTNYITLLYKNSTYNDTKYIITIFNKTITSSNTNLLSKSGKYNPEVTDGVWDENDWYYEDPNNESMGSYFIDMNGENIWYYKKPGSIIIPEEEIKPDIIGSGFYMESSAYIGDITLIEGSKYYMAFDIETNFNGKIQIFNTADNCVNSNDDRIYEVSKGISQHISQVFIANKIETPEIRFLIYDFDNYPINIGDYIIVKNIRFVRAYSDNFIAQDIPSYDKIQELYKTNEAIYKYIAKCMTEESDIKKYKIYKKIYDSLMISKYNKEAFKISDDEYAKTYTDFIKTRDSVLYTRLNRFKNLDQGTMHKEISDEIIEITYAIDDCVDTYSYGFLYSYFPAVSANYIQQYITKLINWFKSWKVHLLGINTLYSLGDKSENIVKILEGQEYKNKYDNIKTNYFIYDATKINPLDDGYDYNFDKYTNSYKDSSFIKDRVRIIISSSTGVEYIDSQNQIKYTFNNDGSISTSDGFKITNSESGFTNDNHEVISLQLINEINLRSLDYIDWRK